MPVGMRGVAIKIYGEVDVRQQKVRSVLVALVVCLAVGVAGPAGAADEGGAKNVVLAQNTTDGNSFARSGVMVAYDAGDTVANENLALANSFDCTGCRTVAVAMQVVIVESSPQDVAPKNAAVAGNGGCVSCQTYAYAYQYVITPGTMVTLSATAQQSIADIRRQAAGIADSGGSYDDIRVQLDGLCNQLAAVVTTDLGMTDAPACVADSQAAEA